MLSLKQLDDVCLVSDKGSGRCRYLTQDEVDPQKFYCLKLSPKSKKIDEEIKKQVEDNHSPSQWRNSYTQD